MASTAGEIPPEVDRYIGGHVINIIQGRPSTAQICAKIVRNIMMANLFKIFCYK